MHFRVYLCAFISVLLIGWQSIPALAQFDTDYWMPPVWESRDATGGSTSPTELVITTPYDNAIVVITLSDGSFVASESVQPGFPKIVPLSTVEGMTYDANTAESNKGLRIQSDFPVQVVYRNTSNNNQCLSPLKGRFALGKDFLAGSQTRVKNGGKYGKDDVHFISVMATEDNTRVTFRAPGAYFHVGAGSQQTITVTLNKNQTYLVRNNNDGLAGDNASSNLSGTRVTSDKPIAVMTGGQHLRYEDETINNEFDADAGIDQAVPINSDIFKVIGTEYVIVRGGAQKSETRDAGGKIISVDTDSTDYAIIIATEDSTDIRINGVETPVGTIDEGEIYEYRIGGGSGALGTPYYINTSKPAYLYHVSGLRKQELGMSAVPTIDCAGSQYIAFNRFNRPGVSRTDLSNYDNTINIIGSEDAFSTLKINGVDYLEFLNGPDDYEFDVLRTVPGKPELRTATFSFPKSEDDIKNNMIIRSDGFFHLGVVVGGTEGGTYGYLSSFAQKVDILDPTLFPLRLPTVRYRVGAVAQGDTITHCLEAVSCDPEHHIETITPSSNTGDTFRQGEFGQAEDICLKYVAKTDYLGTDTIEVIVRNGRGIPGRVALVYEVVHLPETAGDTVIVVEGGTATGNVLDNDDVDAGEIAQLTKDVTHGTVTLNPNGSYSYTPDPGFQGRDSLTYQVCDAVIAQSCSETTVYFEVGFFLDDVPKTGVQDRPVPFTATEFSDQFHDADGGTLEKIQVVSLPDTGTLMLNGIPVTAGQEISLADIDSLVYIPAPGYFGPVAFEWNGHNGTEYADEPALVTISLTDVNLVFHAQDSTYAVDRNTPYQGNLSDNISDPNGGGFTFTTNPLTNPQHGTVTLNPDGTFTYTPEENFFGRDSLVYEVCSVADPADCQVATAYFDVLIPDDDLTDADDDGIPDVIEVGEDQNNPVDTDNDGVPDFQDEDSDNDGIPDAMEVGSDPMNPVDTDGDGIPDYMDLDSDNDGIPDILEAGNDPTNPVDTDNDGMPDFQDDDSDNDGIPDAMEVGSDPTNPVDTDDDGMPDYLDLDSDNDTIPDMVEAGSDPMNPVDTDEDGMPDYQDTDSDNDTIPDMVEAGSDPMNPVDTDGDGMPDYQDTNSDNDMYTDAEEAGPDPMHPQDLDNDGMPDYQDAEQGLTIYEGFSPGGANDTWEIDGIQAFPNNKVQIFNRWGNKVYEVNSYNNSDQAWRGTSNVGSIGGNEVPDGTYFYIIDLGDGKKPRTGYVVVNR